MYEAIADAIEAQDWATAGELLVAVEGEGDDLENPTLGYYQARLREANGEFDQAEEKFRQLLVLAVNPQLVAKIRAGLGRIQAHHQAEAEQALEEQKSAIAAAKATSGAESMAIFILEPVPQEDKKAKAVQFGKIMKIDPYSARLQLPSRAWRLYRTGAIGELNYYQQQCQQAEIPSFSVALDDISALTIHPIFHIESLSPEVTVSYRISREKQELFSFNWTDVSQTVEGLLPIFEECVEVDFHGKIQRKTEVLDYAHIFDLHLPKQRTILRFCDQIYAFSKGIALETDNFSKEKEGTSHQQWQQLIQFLQSNLPDKPVWKEFKAFAETALDFQELLKLVDPHVHFMRREESPWDKAFHLYSGLAFCRQISEET